MKKIIIILVVVLAVMLGIAPNFIGQQAESKFKELYAEMANTPGLSFEVLDYERTWFNSTASVKLNVNLADFDPTMDDVLTFTINSTMKHGPILTEVGGLGLGLMDIDSEVEFPAFMTDQFPDLNDRFNELLSLQSRLTLGGDTHSISELKEFNFSEEGVNISVNPARFVSTASTDGEVTLEGSWDGLSISDGGTFGITLGEIEMDLDMESMDGNLYDPTAIFLGEGSLGMAEMRITGQEIPGVVELKGIMISSESDAKDDMLFGNVDMGIAELNAMGMNFTDIIMNQSFSNLDVESLKKINELNYKMTDQNMDMVLSQMGEIGLAMLDKKPVYSIRELGMTTAQGKMSSEMTFTVDENLIDVNNLMTIAQAMEIDGSGYVPEAFLNSMGVGPMVQGYIDAGFVKRDGDNLTFELQMKSGQVTLSGQPLPMF